MYSIVVRHVYDLQGERYNPVVWVQSGSNLQSLKGPGGGSADNCPILCSPNHAGYFKWVFIAHLNTTLLFHPRKCC